MIRTHLRLRALPIAAAGVCLLLPAPPAHAQQPPSQWTIGVEFGGQLPATLYDERVIARRVGADTTFGLSTQYAERIRPVPTGRIVLRFRPESDFGAFVAYQYGTAGTTAEFSGGEGAPEQLQRDVDIWAVEFGMSVLLSRWANGRGLFEYTLAPTLIHHSLDLSRGHRDAFALASGAPRDQPLNWTSRKWYSWAFGLGASARFPISDPLSIRVAAHSHVISVGTAALAAQEREDVRRLTGGRAPVFVYSAFTAYYPSLRIGLEYVLQRQVPRATPTVALPRAARAPDPTPETIAAARLAAQGDTASAISLLRRRLRDDPEDSSAWRELGLILAARAESSPAARDEAWDAIQRAVHTNPADVTVLAAYGRVRALIQRTGVAPPPAARLELSAVNARADGAGVLSLAWSIQNLSPGDPASRYRILVQVTDQNGSPVPIRTGEDPDNLSAVFQAERETTFQPVVERLELRLAQALQGPHSVRVRVTDLATGRAVERTTGFEIR